MMMDSHLYRVNHLVPQMVMVEPMLHGVGKVEQSVSNSDGSVTTTISIPRAGFSIVDYNVDAVMVQLQEMVL